MNIADILRNNPSYNKLKIRLVQSSSHNIYDIVEISGIPFSLQQELSKELSKDLASSLVIIIRDSLDIRKYIRTIQYIELSSISLSKLIKILNNHSFNRCLKVLEPSQYSLTGDNLMFWPIGYPHPIRASFFDEYIEDAYIIDEIFHQKYEKVNGFTIGDISYLNERSLFSNIEIISPHLNPLKKALIFTGESELQQKVLNFDYTYPSLYFLRFDLLTHDIERYIKKDYKILLLTNNKNSIPSKLHSLIIPPIDGLETGIESSSQKLLFLTDRELFGTIFLSKATKRLSSSKARQMLADLEGEIEIDDYIVHEDHGVGIYKGIKQEEFEMRTPIGFGQYSVNKLKEDYILIQYSEGDELYVPLTQINKITKYIAEEGTPIELTRLGRSEWRQYSNKIKADIKQVASELVSLYAAREIAKAPKIDVEFDSEYKSFCDDFQFEVTADQLRSEKEVLADLILDKPMNRLLVGDVGFGKTEVAVRASFIVARSNYQIAILCPTTVLALQHEKVFTDRFKNTDIKIASLSRLSKFSNRKVIEGLKNGSVNIVIGTHRLLSSDVEFIKLGLIVIDEEQKFGVKQKEKLKKISKNVHVLNMSATPIPRTLSMALSSIQDISLIATPPRNRLSIKTYVLPMNISKLVEAIEKEVSRGGQVYYLHNRVETITSVKNKLERLLPNIKFVTAHGQLDANTLSDRISDFYAGRYDCLICTTIIENGIDMPNVNTIIIEHSQNFGLGQLYQLRGRVGRSKRQAYAYLFFEGDLKQKEENDLDAKKKKELKYIKRLKAIMEATDLGSGFKLASKDLEIRGAGNLLGKQQHGHIKYMGYGLYMQLLALEIERQKNATNI